MNKKEISKYFSEMAKKRHKKMTKAERSAHGLKMYLGTKRAKEREKDPVHKSA
jgi:hypothetical protein